MNDKMNQKIDGLDQRMNKMDEKIDILINNLVKKPQEDE